LEKTKLDGNGIPLLELLTLSGLCSGKGQARKDVEAGGIYLNNVRETTPQRSVTSEMLLFGKHLLLRKGKRNYLVVTAR
jgi:tyrosyl-tRNA synthetase